MTNAWSDLVNTTLDLAAERDALADRLAGVPDVPEGHELVVLPKMVVDARAVTAAQAWCRVGTRTNDHGTTRTLRVRDLPDTPDRHRVLMLRETWGYWP